jgi:haloalkane dehalogenase
VRIAQDYSEWMAGNDMPKLFVNADPGAILIGAIREFCRGWKNQTEVTVPGSHFIQEDSGPAIGRAVAGWMTANAL